MARSCVVGKVTTRESRKEAVRRLAEGGGDALSPNRGQTRKRKTGVRPPKKQNRGLTPRLQIRSSMFTTSPTSRSKIGRKKGTESIAAMRPIMRVMGKPTAKMLS